MYIIVGIDHPRILGIDEKDGKAYAFNPQNNHGYRDPQTPEEEAALLMCGKKYYDECVTHLYPFGILEIGGQPLKALQEKPELFKVLSNTFIIEPTDSRIFIKTCKYCGNLFRPQSGRQTVCKRKECQSRRNVEKAQRWKDNNL